jgi:transposase
MRRFELIDAQWEQIAPPLPTKKLRTGWLAEDHRHALNGMLWIQRTGCALEGRANAPW